MSNKSIHTDAAPAAIGTYSQAVATSAAQTIYISGQIPLDPDTMDVVSDQFRAQAEQVFKNLSAICQAANGNLSDCVKLTIYLIDLGNFSAVNEVMASFFDAPYPARAAIEVSALPRGVSIEIDAIMTLG